MEEVYTRWIWGKGFKIRNYRAKIFHKKSLIGLGSQVTNLWMLIDVPQRFLISKGFVKIVGSSVQEKYLLCKSEGNYRIFEAHRLNRKVENKDNFSYATLMTFLLTFEGKNRPNEIDIFAYPS